MLIVPFQPRSVFAVLNAADPGTSSDNTEAAAALSDFPQLTLLDAPIRRRKAFANALGLGLSVEELCGGLGHLDRFWEE